MVKCPRCGYENNSINAYCENCSYPLENSKPSFNGNNQKQGWNLNIFKKIILVVGIIVIALLLFSFIYNATQPSNQDTLNVITANESQKQPSSMPYQVKVIYNGSWYGKMGDPNYLVEHSASGSRTYSLDCTAWDRISVDVQKSDYSTKNMTVQLLRNGEVVAENSTIKENGRIVLSYN